MQYPRHLYLTAQVGVHGIVINFTDDRGSSYSATFLPEVAAEQGARADYAAYFSH